MNRLAPDQRYRPPNCPQSRIIKRTKASAIINASGALAGKPISEQLMIMPRGKDETDAEWRRAYFWPVLLTPVIFIVLGTVYLVTSPF
jgi:hypothetical protein